MAAKKLPKKIETTVGAAVADAYVTFEELKDELQSWYDNLPESLQSSSKADTLQEAIDNLESVFKVEVPENLADIKCTYTVAKGSSRRARRDEACNALYSAVEAVELMFRQDDEGVPEEIQEVLDEIQEMIDNAECAEFPGMYG